MTRLSFYRDADTVAQPRPRPPARKQKFFGMAVRAECDVRRNTPALPKKRCFQFDENLRTAHCGSSLRALSSFLVGIREPALLFTIGIVVFVLRTVLPNEKMGGGRSAAAAAAHCLSRSKNEPLARGSCAKREKPPAGIEPATYRLLSGCSAAELGRLWLLRFSGNRCLLPESSRQRGARFMRNPWRHRHRPRMTSRNAITFAISTAQFA